MRGIVGSRTGVLVVAVMMAAIVVLGNGIGWRNAARTAERSPTWREQEVARVQAHLAGAERVLLDADTAHLTAEQRAARAMNIALLRGYRVRGEFPRNIDFPGERQPYFVDDRGVLCAMAHLIACSGRGDIVERVRTTRNNARIKDLTDDPTLVGWLEDAGLTLAEAARIQPEYKYGPDQTRISARYGLASTAASMANGAAIAWNLAGAWDNPPHRRRGMLGLATSALSIGLGLANVQDDGDVQKLAYWNLALGAVSFGVSTNSLFRESGTPKTSSSVTRPDDSRAASLRVAPMLGSAPGLQLALSF